MSTLVNCAGFVPGSARSLASFLERATIEAPARANLAKALAQPGRR